MAILLYIPDDIQVRLTELARLVLAQHVAARVGGALGNLVDAYYHFVVGLVLHEVSRAGEPFSENFKD